MLLHPEEEMRGIGFHEQHRAVFGTDESLRCQLIEHREQRPEESVDVEQRVRLAMEPNLAPGPDLEEFLERAKASGKPPMSPTCPPPYTMRTFAAASVAPRCSATTRYRGLAPGLDPQKTQSVRRAWPPAPRDSGSGVIPLSAW